MFYDAVGPDNAQVFVEVAGAAGTSLEGWSIAVVNGSDGAVVTTLALAGSIPADRLFVVADRDSDGSTQVSGADLTLNFDIQNGPDSVQLFDAGATLRDALGFGSFGSGEVFAGEGTPAPDAAAGESLSRRFADVDTDDNAADFEVLAAPTPGVAVFSGDGGGSGPPGAAIPEPHAGLLCALGLVALAARRRRGA